LFFQLRFRHWPKSLILRLDDFANLVPERILMEVDCLRMAGGKSNVLPLLFVHRCLGDVVLAMPYIEASKFSDVIKTMDFVELKLYMKNLLIALAHIHSLGIIHR
jgi:cell division control protein 7